MDRNAIIRGLVIAAVLRVFWKWGMPLISGKSSEKGQEAPSETYVNAPDFVPDTIDDGKAQPPEGQICRIKGNRFEAELSSRGAAIKHFNLTDPTYATSAAADMSTTLDHGRWRSLRTRFRSAEANDQLKYDRFNWQTEQLGEGGCRFTYQDEDVKIVKTVTANPRPYELNVVTDVTNLTDAPKKHRYAISQFAYRTNKQIK